MIRYSYKVTRMSIILRLYIFTFTFTLIGFYFVRGHARNAFVDQPKSSYDYIIVGAGSAGSVIANRLSEDPKVTVLAVEAGGDDSGDTFISTPIYTPALEILSPDKITNYYTESNRLYRGLRKGQSKWRRGTVLGGSSCANYMSYMRGSRKDFDRWADYTNHSTWNYNSVLSYFKKSEKMLTPELRESVYHNGNGNLAVTRSDATSFIGPKIIESFQELGYPFNEDYNGQRMEGVARLQETIENGERSNTARAFLHPIQERLNLNIAINSRVLKVIIKNMRAESVELVKEGRKFNVRARREVILSAGAIETPKLLMLSGVGPKSELDKFNISQVVDLPVGRNLHDHHFIELPVEYNCSVSNDSLNVLDTLVEYQINRTGRMATAGLNILAVTSVTKTRKANYWPDLKMLFVPKDFKIGTGLLKSLNVDPELIQSYSYRDKVTTSFACAVINLNPLSRGRLTLRSTDPFDPPMIFPNYLDNKGDIRVLLKGVQLIKRLVDTNSLKSVSARLVDTRPLSICREFVPGTDEHWECVIKSRPQTSFDPVGTCKMGQNNDPTAVVNPRLMVRGIQGLRVADASVIPFIPAGTINPTAILIGEMVADFIKGQRLPPTLNV